MPSALITRPPRRECSVDPKSLRKCAAIGRQVRERKQKSISPRDLNTLATAERRDSLPFPIFKRMLAVSREFQWLVGLGSKELPALGEKNFRRQLATGEKNQGKRALGEKMQVKRAL